MSAMPTPSPQRRNQPPTDPTAEVRALAYQLFGTRDGVEFWMKHPNPELGGQTPEGLIAAGNATAVKNFLEGCLEGDFG